MSSNHTWFLWLVPKKSKIHSLCLMLSPTHALLDYYGPMQRSSSNQSLAERNKANLHDLQLTLTSLQLCCKISYWLRACLVFLLQMVSTNKTLKHDEVSQSLWHCTEGKQTYLWEPALYLHYHHRFWSSWIENSCWQPCTRSRTSWRKSRKNCWVVPFSFFKVQAIFKLLSQKQG